jgi:hypothetical protein
LVSDAIQRNNRFRVIDHVTSSSEVVSAVRKAQPDVAVISARLQDGASDGLWALQGLRALTHGKIKNPFQLASTAPPFRPTFGPPDRAPPKDCRGRGVRAGNMEVLSHGAGFSVMASEYSLLTESDQP